MKKDTCTSCGKPKADHLEILKSKTWNAAGMGYIHSYVYLCPTLSVYTDPADEK